MNDCRFLPLLLVGSIALAGCGRPAVQPGEEAPEVVKSSGQTMGTYYAVTIADPPARLPEDWHERVDGELRRVNDQMSTYLKSSEISRFNDSQSLDWFPVSAETALVVAAAQEVSRATGGAFDVTIGPLVDAWNFGPTQRTQRPPTAAEIETLRRIVGFEHLEVRTDPPGLRKKIPELRVDLSAIAKGHGVDRILELLVALGCEHVFVDIGGEVRAIGRRGTRAWRVAIEDPNRSEQRYRVAIELHDQAIATSGDYRNFFEFEGERYSHTIDPRTGLPITNGVASVSVIAEDCMLADAWATALTVLGSAEGMEIARQMKLTVRIVEREGDDQLRLTQSDTFPENILPLPDAAQ